jgi:hypothetical protein
MDIKTDIPTSDVFTTIDPIFHTHNRARASPNVNSNSNA